LTKIANLNQKSKQIYGKPEDENLIDTAIVPNFHLQNFRITPGTRSRLIEEQTTQPNFQATPENQTSNVI
jgi:hypothetical protein